MKAFWVWVPQRPLSRQRAQGVYISFAICCCIIFIEEALRRAKFSILDKLEIGMPKIVVEIIALPHWIYRVCLALVHAACVWCCGKCGKLTQLWAIVPLRWLQQ